VGNGDSELGQSGKKFWIGSGPMGCEEACCFVGSVVMYFLCLSLGCRSHCFEIKLIAPRALERLMKRLISSQTDFWWRMPSLTGTYLPIP